MTDRHTADSITDDALDALYQQLEDDAKVIRYLESQEQRLLQVEGELTALRQVARGYCPACGRGDAAPTVDDWEQQKQRAERAEAAIARDQPAAAQTTQPRERCGHLSPDTGLSSPRTECVLRPGHTGSHADDVGCRWWPITEQQPA